MLKDAPPPGSRQPVLPACTHSNQPAPGQVAEAVTTSTMVSQPGSTPARARSSGSARPCRRTTVRRPGPRTREGDGFDPVMATSPDDEVHRAIQDRHQGRYQAYRHRPGARAARQPPSRPRRAQGDRLAVRRALPGAVQHPVHRPWVGTRGVQAMGAHHPSTPTPQPQPPQRRRRTRSPAGRAPST
jgi:hypothetical protein